MAHPLETSVETAIDRLRTRTGMASVRPGQHIVPGVWIAADTAKGDFGIERLDDPEALLALRIRVLRPGRWLSLNIMLDRAPLTPDTVLGLVADLRCTPAVSMGVTIRSGVQGVEQDHRFADTPLAGPDPAPVLALSTVKRDGGADSLTATPDWRNLMLRLPVRDLDLTISGLHLFVAPPGGRHAHAPMDAVPAH